MKIGTTQLGSGCPPYIVAEIGVNHDGSIDRAIELVEIAKQAGANAIKLQLFETDRLLSKAAKLAAYQTQSGVNDPFSMLRSLELNVDQMASIVDAAHKLQLHAIVTVFSIELVPHASRLQWDAYKLASPDIINRPLLEALMRTNRPLLLSTGAATLEEVAQATVWLGETPHILMQCVSAYPVSDDRASLFGRASLCSVNPNSFGYSDHTASIDTGALAVASGATVLEKHLTHDRNAVGPDHAASLDAAGFAEYVRLAHRAHCMMGHPRKEVLDIEQDVRRVSRQSLTTTRSLPIGHVLSREDLTIKRPGTGISPAKLSATVGRRLRHAIDADMPIVEGDLQ